MGNVINEAIEFIGNRATKKGLKAAEKALFNGEVSNITKNKHNLIKKEIKDIESTITKADRNFAKTIEKASSNSDNAEDIAKSILQSYSENTGKQGAPLKVEYDKAKFDKLKELKSVTREQLTREVLESDTASNIREYASNTVNGINNNSNLQGDYYQKVKQHLNNPTRNQFILEDKKVIRMGQDGMNIPDTDTLSDKALKKSANAYRRAETGYYAGIIGGSGAVAGAGAGAIIGTATGADEDNMKGMTITGAGLGAVATATPFMIARAIAKGIR